MDESDTLQSAQFIQRLADRLASGPLPGVAAQRKMSSVERRWAPDAAELPTLRKSAVLALLHPSPAGLALLYTLRPSRLAHHGGQVSFPGGGMEEGDVSLAHTALRETAEELGMTTADVQILGPLTPLFIESSRNLVHPFVGWISGLPSLNPDIGEVAEVLSVTLQTLADPATVTTCVREINGQPRSFPSFYIPPHHIWGATAMMTSELLAIVAQVRGVDFRADAPAPPDRQDRIPAHR
ncbi:MAG: CoA pyrophosphatase [Anaerolineae bacterium]